MSITYINGDNIPNKIPLYIFAFVSWFTLIGLPYLINSESVMGKIDDEEVYSDDNSKVGISLQRKLPNTIITVIYFGFIVNAIVTQLRKYTGVSPGASSKDGLNKLVARSIGKKFGAPVYMAILIVLINVFSTGYIYYNCEDKSSDFLIRSIITSQYNIVIITVLGVIAFSVSYRLNKT
tara:strand:- start:25 stop:561 length:537 start_codon:yes stop_codon:yes gene_type:complete